MSALSLIQTKLRVTLEARDRVVLGGNVTPTTEGFHKAAHAMAEFDAELAVFRHAAAMAETVSPLTLFVWAARQAMEPPRDEWSGRGNDLRRTAHAARLGALSFVADASQVTS